MAEKNILIITNHFFPENFRVNDIAFYLAEKNNRVTVLTGIPNYPQGKFYTGYGIFKKRKEIINGVSVIRVPLIPRGKDSTIQLSLNYLSYTFFLLLYSFVFSLRYKYDLIFVHHTSPIFLGIPAVLVKKIQKISLFFWNLDLWPESVAAAGNLKTSIIPKLLLPLVRWIYKNCDKILVSSKGFISSITEKGVPKEKIEYFPQWAESIFKPVNNDQSSFNVDLPDGFKILFAGNIGEAQDFESVLNAAELLRDNKKIQWIILGDGSRYEFVKQQVKSRNLESTFHLLGKHPLVAMPYFYSQADALLLSLKKEHIFSLTVPAKLQSYLACGRPILTMLDGEGSEIVKNANAGLTCGSGDYKALAENVISISQMDSKTFNQYGTNARQYYLNNFERDKLLAKLENILQSHSSHKN